MDLDLGQVRAFVAVVDHGHFGRAATALSLSQQAVSKRVGRLEGQLGTLIERRHEGAVPTAAGERLLPAARRLLDTADRAVADVRAAPIPALRVDVWSEVQTPARLIRAVGRGRSDLPLELSMRRDLGEALAAVARHEVDVAFGDLTALERALPEQLASEVVVEDEIAMLVSAHGPLAAATEITAADVARHGLWWPLSGSSGDLRATVTRYGAALGAPIHDLGSNLGLEALVDHVATRPEAVTPIVRAWSLPARDDVRLLPLRPPLTYPWSAVWRRDDAHPVLPRLLRALRASSRGPRGTP